MISCQDAELLISCNLDGECSPHQEAQLDQHLENCPSCRALLQAETSTSDLLTVGLATDSQHLLSLEGKILSEVHALPGVSRRPRLFLPMSMAAGFLFGVGMWVVLQSLVLSPNSPPSGSEMTQPSSPVTVPDGPSVLVSENQREELPTSVDGDPNLRLQTEKNRVDIIDSIKDKKNNKDLRFRLEIERQQRQMYKPATNNWY